KMPRMHVVFGAYDGPIDAKPGEKVVFIGDCARWQGSIGDKVVSIESLYRDRSTKDPHHAEADDIYVKMKNVNQKLWAARNDQVIRLQGCPVSVAEQLFALVVLGKAKNPYLEPSEAVAYNQAYLGWKAAMAVKRLKGERYQQPGGCSRGEARPDVSGGEAE
ncbi:MAG TPA: DUF362 domain-containing protein, partial [Polyangiaceae bacterium]|nr:DUF362 domain-containing protein [Polyangiaceae bacterium]